MAMGKRVSTLVFALVSTALVTQSWAQSPPAQPAPLPTSAAPVPSVPAASPKSSASPATDAAIQAKIDAIGAAPTLLGKRTAPPNSIGSDITPDTRSTYGILPNGMRYVIRNNDTPKETVLVRMQVDFGSAAEAEDEQGLAHFIEHMAFNGTTNVPEGDMIKLLERKGLAFGPDTNASTGYLKTTYMLNLPKPSDDLLNTALFLMRETASEITFDPAAVDKERGIVLEEKRVRENFGAQAGRAAQKFLRPGTYFDTRFPIGTEQVLKTAPAERMKNLYRKWYRPERTTLIIVGPIDVKNVEAKIAKSFASWKAASPSPLPEESDLDRCTIDLTRKPDAASFAHPQMTESFSVQQFGKARFTKDSLAARKDAVILGLAEEMFQRRIARIVRTGDAPFLATGVSYGGPSCQIYSSTSFGISAKDGKMAEALPAAEQLLRQALQYGFSQAELDEQIKEYRVSNENAVKSEPTRSSGAIVSGHLSELSPYKSVLTTAAWRLAEWQKFEKQIKLKDVNSAFVRTYGRLDKGLIFASGKPENVPDNAALAALLAKSRAVAVKAPEQQAKLSFAYTNFGTPGTIAADSTIKDVDIRTIRFANGVMLNLKKTPYDASRVLVSMAVDGGNLLLPKNKASYENLGDLIGSGGLGKHKLDDLQSLTAGTSAGAGFGTSEDSFVSSANVVQKDLLLQLQLMAAYVTDPGYRDEAITRWRKTLPEFYARLDATPGSTLGNRSAPILYGDDPRYKLAPIEELQALNWAEYRSLIGDALSKNAIEIGIVGDFDMDATIAAVAQTFGALPQRAPKFEDRSEAQKLSWGAKRGAFTFEHKGEPDQLAWQRIWPTTDGLDQKLDYSMDVLADIISIRLTEELREKAGASYGASVGSSMGVTVPGFGSFTISTNGDVAKMALIEGIVQQVVDEVRSKPVDADLFERARKPTLESYASWRQKNSTWYGIVADVQSFPLALERFRKNEDVYKSITPDDVWKAAKTLLKDDQAFTFRAVPAAKVAAPVAASPATPTIVAKP